MHFFCVSGRVFPPDNGTERGEPTDRLSVSQSLLQGPSTDGTDGPTSAAANTVKHQERRCDTSGKSTKTGTVLQRVRLMEQ